MSALRGARSRAADTAFRSCSMTLEFAGNVLCSAGVSYFHVYPNGDVYRCLADYNARRPPMFNLKRDAWKGAVEPTVCDHERCYNACDLDWTTKWQVDEQGRLEKTFEGQRNNIEKEVSRFLCSQRLEAPERRMAYFIWSPTLACNYTCAYCGCAAGEKPLRNDFPSSYPELTVDEWIDIWSDVLERFKYGILSITGGEPLLSEATIPVLGMMTQKFACYMTSNISRNIMEFTHDRIRPGRGPCVVEGFGEVPIGLSGINCSLHPTSKGFNWELFKGSILLLKSAGFHVSVNYVGYPLQLYLAPEYKAWCEENNIEFTLSSWQGVDNDGLIARYSAPERAFFEKMAPQHRKQTNELVFMECSYDVTLDSPFTRVHASDVLTLTGRIRNLSHTAWPVGSGPGRWSVAGYLTRIGRRKLWLREFRTSPPDCSVPHNGELEFAVPIDTRGLPAGVYEVWLDMLMDGKNWMALHGAVRVAATLRVETFSHEIAVDADALTLSPGGTAVLSGTLRNPCGKPWPEGAGGEPLKLGARLFRRSVQSEAVREFRALLEGLPETAEDAVGFRLVLDPGELTRGDYELTIDVVKEDQFWLAEKGATPKVIPVVIA
jgi:MoaA/NifB/PqqE/SkfB family radical SAM enzyme